MKNIFCAYDFSDAGNNALQHACKLADYFNANITIVYIYNIPVPVTEFGYIDVGDEVIRRSAEKELEALKTKLISEHPHINSVNYIVETGLVAYKLNKLAKSKNCDLLVMGIDNEKNFIKEHVLGSTSIDEAREFKVPVLIVPKTAESKKIRSIAFASDYKHTAENSTSLIQVKFYATIFNSPLSVVHVLEPDHSMDMSEAMKDKFIEKKLENTEHKTFLVYEKNAADGIVEFVKAHDIDLIIVEPYHRNFFDRLFHKSTTKELAFHLSKPILAIHGE